MQPSIQPNDPAVTSITPPARSPEPRTEYPYYGSIDELFNAFPGVFLAGGCYPLVIIVFGTAFSVLTEGVNSDALYMVLPFLIFTFCASLLGGFYAGIVSIFGLLLVGALNASMQLKANPVRMATFAGGLTGYVCTLMLFGVGFGFPRWNHSWTESLITIAAGPVLATVLGQLGGAWGAGFRRVEEYRPHVPGRWQFSVRQLLVATAWIAVLVTVVQITPFATAGYAIGFCLWLVLQYGSLLAVIRFFEWREMRGGLFR